MLYLVRPNWQMKWSDLPDSVVEETEKLGNVDLAKLAWADSERAQTATIVRLALRNGAPCSAGIVVPSRGLYSEYRLGELQTLQVDSADWRAPLKGHDEFMESIMPGWVESGRQLDEKITDSLREEAREAAQDLETDLKKEPKQSLLDHWNALGGRVPDPA